LLTNNGGGAVNAQHFANEWIAAWNSHDIDRILSHYTDDFEITTPMIKTVMSIESGTLKGKAAIRDYWLTALQKIPDLHFELREVTHSIGSIALYYQSVFGKMAIEVMFYDEQGKIKKVIAHYN